MHISWGIGVVWWTLFGLPLLPFIPIPANANDFWVRLRPGGAVPQPVNPPPGATDVEMFWDEERLVAAWWTRDGIPIEPLSLSEGAQELHVATGEPVPIDDWTPEGGIPPTPAGSIAVFFSGDESPAGLSLSFDWPSSRPRQDELVVTLSDVTPRPEDLGADGADVTIRWADAAIEVVTAEVALSRSPAHFARGYWLDEAGIPIAVVGQSDVLFSTGTPDRVPALRFLPDVARPDPRLPRPLPDPVPTFPTDIFWGQEATRRFNEWTREKNAGTCNCKHTETWSGPQIKSVPEWELDALGQPPHWKHSETGTGESDVGGEHGKGAFKGAPGFAGATIPPPLGMTRHWFFRKGKLVIKDYKVWALRMEITCTGAPPCPAGETFSTDYGEKVGERTIDAVEMFYVDLPNASASGLGTVSIKIEDEVKDGKVVGLKATQPNPAGGSTEAHLGDYAPPNADMIRPSTGASPGTYGPGLP